MIELIATLTASAIVGAVGVFAFIQRRSWRGLVRSLALVTIILGAYFLGIAKLLVDASAGFVAWIQATAWTQQMTNASIVSGAGLLVFLLAGYLPAGQQPEQPTTGKANSPAPAKQIDKSNRPPVDSEDDEIEALLKARGIQ